MVENGKTLTTGEFSRMTGISAPTITQMLRQDKIRGEKRSGKWAIFESELQNKTILGKKGRGKALAGPDPIFNAHAAPKAYDVQTFVQMTYLTEKGVRQWLKTGRLSGRTDANGNLLVDTANLNRSEFKHLVRK